MPISVAPCDTHAGSRETLTKPRQPSGPARAVTDICTPRAVIVADQSWDTDAEGFPAGSDTELLVEGGGVFQGRFLMTPGPDTRPTAEQRLLAAALADQVGAALATSHPVSQD